MPVRDEWRRLKLCELRLEPERFSFSWPAQGGDLRESLAADGQRCPLLVGESPEGPTLLGGHRRFEALVALGAREAWGRPAAAEGPRELWDLLLREQRAGRELNPVEVGLYAVRRQAATGETLDDLAQRVCPLLGLAPRAGALGDYLWVAGLPNRHRDGFAAGRLPLQAVRLLSRSSAAEAAAILDALGDAPVGGNKLSELTRWLQECTWSTGETVDGWLEARGLAQYRGRPELLRGAVRRLRYPRLAEWESSFGEDLRALPLPAQARINHPQGFEGGALSCTLSFASLTELEEAVAAVQELLRAGELEPLGKYLG